MTAIEKVIGPVTARRLREIGISTRADLEKCGAVAAYAALRHRFDKAVTLNALYALEAVLRGVDWRALDGPTRQALAAAAGVIAEQQQKNARRR